MLTRFKKFPFIFEKPVEKLVPGDMLFIRIKGCRSIATCVAAIVPDGHLVMCKITLVTNKGALLQREWHKLDNKFMLLEVVNE